MRFKGRKVLGVLAAVFALSGLTAASALASGKPFVETKPASSIEETTATLNGVVNPNGAETKYYFEYGTVKGKLTTKTTEASAGSGESNVQESKAVTGLTASTTYYFRVVATNGSGTTDGSEEAFSTTGKPFAETKPASWTEKTEAGLVGIVNPRGSETKYYFEYGTTESYGSKTAEASAGSGTGNVEEDKAAVGLTEGTKYHFRIVATNSKGTTDGADQAFTTSSLPQIWPYVKNEAITGTGGVVYFEQDGGGDWKCSSTSLTGTMVGPKELAKVVLSMNCESQSFNFCSQEKGSWTSKELKGRIAYLSKEKGTVGLLLEPASGNVIATCQNAEGEIELKGSVIAAFKPDGLSFKEAVLSYGGSDAKQEFTHFEGEEVLHKLERKGPVGTEVVSMSTALTLKFKETKELQA